MTAKPKESNKTNPLDVSAFPPESITVLEKWICLACVSHVFTRQLELAARTAHLEIKRYIPTIQELYAPTPARPWFVKELARKYCPYCGSAEKWHTRLHVYRIESGKATDASRRELFKSLPQSGNQFAVLEEKATRQDAFFEWLEKVSKDLNLDDPGWLREVSRHYLSRKEPKADWQALFDQIHSIRRSRRLENGWEVDKGRLFLAPTLFDELLLVQYLISRSHRAGGVTLEGRYTLAELFARLRNAGYLRATGIRAQNPGDVLEELVAYLGGGESPIKFYHIVDRRDFLEKVKTLKVAKPPRSRAR
ncbi:MAG TPA: hypothetical protein VKR61_09925 [Bryobacteraceae bacterium]|nr:hypothetical protein [Bryobacteraceae bacterium]